MSTAAYQKEWRARHGARTGILGRPRIYDCGTPAAYSRHVRNGEPIDDACRLAWNAYQAERRLVRLAKRAAIEAEAQAKRDAKNAKVREARAAKKAAAAAAAEGSP